MKGEPAEDVSFLGNTFTRHRIATLHTFGNIEGAGAGTTADMVVTIFLKVHFRVITAAALHTGKRSGKWDCTVILKERNDSFSLFDFNPVSTFLHEFRR